MKKNFVTAEICSILGKYDMRWAAQKLRNNKTFKPIADSSKGMWELANLDLVQT